MKKKFYKKLCLGPLFFFFFFFFFFFLGHFEFSIELYYGVILDKLLMMEMIYREGVRGEGCVVCVVVCLC